MSLAVVIAIWSVSAVVSLPGLAVSPIMGDLNKIVPLLTQQIKAAKAQAK